MEAAKYFRNKLHFRCLIGLLINLRVKQSGLFVFSVRHVGSQHPKRQKLAGIARIGIYNIKEI